MGYPTNVIPLACTGTASYDPDALRLGSNDIPASKDDTSTHSKRRAARDRLFIPSMAWPELAAVVAAGLPGRSVGLWLAIRMQAKLEGKDWVRVRTHLRESLGFTNRAAHSRAVTELEFRFAPKDAPRPRAAVGSHRTPATTSGWPTSSRWLPPTPAAMTTTAAGT